MLASRYPSFPSPRGARRHPSSHKFGLFAHRVGVAERSSHTFAVVAGNKHAAAGYQPVRVDAELLAYFFGYWMHKHLFGKVAKPSSEVKEGDMLDILMGGKHTVVKVTSVQEFTTKAAAAEMYEMITRGDLE